MQQTTLSLPPPPPPLSLSFNFRHTHCSYANSQYEEFERLRAGQVIVCTRVLIHSHVFDTFSPLSKWASTTDQSILTVLDARVDAARTLSDRLNSVLLNQMLKWLQVRRHPILFPFFSFSMTIYIVGIMTELCT